jgi:hypothetical protein
MVSSHFTYKYCDLSHVEVKCLGKHINDAGVRTNDSTNTQTVSEAWDCEL